MPLATLYDRVIQLPNMPLCHSWFSSSSLVILPPYIWTECLISHQNSHSHIRSSDYTSQLFKQKKTAAYVKLLASYVSKETPLQYKSTEYESCPAMHRSQYSTSMQHISRK